MPIKNQRRKTEGRVSTQVNIPALVQAGRITLDPSTGLPKMPKRKVISEYKNPNGRTIQVNAGHATDDGSVWRIALRGPSRYAWKVMKDELNFRITGNRSIAAPVLENEEMKEAREFVTFVVSSKTSEYSVLPDNFMTAKYDQGSDMKLMFAKIDAGFYEWKATQEKIELAPIKELFAFLPL